MHNYCVSATTIIIVIATYLVELNCISLGPAIISAGPAVVISLLLLLSCYPVTLMLQLFAGTFFANFGFKTFYWY